jgi:hypothetical protein
MESGEDQENLSCRLQTHRTPTGKNQTSADYDSYQLHLDDEMRPSLAWRYDQVLDLQVTLPERPEILSQIETEARPPMMVIA